MPGFPILTMLDKCYINENKHPSKIILLIIVNYSTTNKGKVWALQQTKKPVGLRLSVQTI